MIFINLKMPEFENLKMGETGGARVIFELFSFSNFQIFNSYLAPA